MINERGNKKGKGRIWKHTYFSLSPPQTSILSRLPAIKFKKVEKRMEDREEEREERG
jgi:hypothetical protein